MPAETLALIATRHQSHYERLKTHEVAKFDPFLKQLDKDIREVLTRSSPETTKALNIQLKRIDAAMRGTLVEYEAVWNESIRESAIYEAGFEKRTLDKVIDGVSFQLPSDAQIKAAVYQAPLGDIGGKHTGELLKPLIKEFTDDEIINIQGIIRNGFAEGQTTPQIIRRVRGTTQARFKDGALAKMKRDQEALVRTTLQHASSQARNDVWDANDDVISMVQWSSTLDSKTSDQCRSLDGQKFPLDKGPRPPIHIRCRSTTIAVLKKEFAFLSKDGQRVVRKPDVSAAGNVVQGKKVTRVAGDQTYYGWLRNQPVKVQNSIIGPTRGKLLRNGGISSQRFAELNLGKDFEPLNLDQMRKMDPVAFEKAGI